MNGVVLIATAYVHTEGATRTEQFWGENNPAYMEKARSWFRELTEGKPGLVGAYLYVRCGVFSADPAYHKPTKWAWMKADHTHVGM